MSAHFWMVQGIWWQGTESTLSCSVSSPLRLFCWPWGARCMGPVWSTEDWSILKRGRLRNTNWTGLSMGAGGVHPWVFREFTNVFVKATLHYPWRNVVFGRKKMSFLPSGRARRRIQGTTVWSSSTWSLWEWGTKQQRKSLPDMWRKRRWLGIVSVNLERKIMLHQSDSLLQGDWWMLYISILQ